MLGGKREKPKLRRNFRPTPQLETQAGAKSRVTTLCCDRLSPKTATRNHPPAQLTCDVAYVCCSGSFAALVPWRTYCICRSPIASRLKSNGFRTRKKETFWRCLSATSQAAGLKRRHWPLLRQTGGNSQLHRGWGCCDIQQHCEHCRAGPVWYLACDESRSVTTVEHQGGRRFFWEGPKFFELCPIVLNYVHYSFSRGGGAKSFSGGASPILRPLVMGVDKSWIAFRFRNRSTKIFRVQ